MAPTLALSSEDLARFHQDGFLKLPNLSASEEIARMREIYDELFAGNEGTGTDMRFDLSGRASDRPRLPQVLDPGVFRPELRETLAWVNAGRIMEQLLGSVPDWRGDHAILKPAGYGAPTPWHQDEAYWDPAMEHRSLSIWLPLQDVDERSGCMCFIPGSHRLDILPHQPIGNDPKVHGLELVEAPPLSSASAIDEGGVWGGRRALAVPLKAGEATVHGGRTLHYAPPNTSDVPRRAYIMMGGLSGKPLPTPRRYPWQELQKAAGAPANRD